jgi:hypothetical protein
MHDIFPAIFDTKHVLAGSQLRELVPDSTLDAAHFKLEDLAAAAAVGMDGIQDGQPAAKLHVFPTIRRAALGAEVAASAAHEAGQLSVCLVISSADIKYRIWPGHDAWMTGCVLVRALAAIDIR